MDIQLSCLSQKGIEINSNIHTNNIKIISILGANFSILGSSRILLMTTNILLKALIIFMKKLLKVDKNKYKN